MLLITLGLPSMVHNACRTETELNVIIMHCASALKAAAPVPLLQCPALAVLAG
jgi:hypothetical protein